MITMYLAEPCRDTLVDILQEVQRVNRALQRLHHATDNDRAFYETRIAVAKALLSQLGERA